ncbi:MAG: CBS domain-containing protein [Flavobacteriales bacterium]|jgi:CBS domain-containing protein|nr:CBS domain-containing protein [Flavobacteriales bacterium]
MDAADLITPAIPPLRPQDEISRALDWMEEFKVEHLPVVDGRRLVGLVHDAVLVDQYDARAPVERVMEQVEVPFVRGGQHVFEVIKLFSERGLTVVPVLDPTGLYLGCINEHAALRRLAEVTNIREPGSIVVLEMNQVDYSLHQLAGIVESNGARVLSAFSSGVPDSMRMEVTLKINREDISDVLRSFERYDIMVRTTYQGSRLQDDMQDRYEGLMRFINP